MIRVAREILPSCRMHPAQTRQARQTPRGRRAALIPARAARSPLERPATELDASTEPLHLALQCQGMQRSEPKIRRSIRRSKASAKGAESGREGGAYWRLTTVSRCDGSFFQNKHTQKCQSIREGNRRSV